ncbi:DUF262 domain-containing protein [Nocardia neocaledoniensis]|uniref:DUF262 domain-containing protein n=1 Tax=Nocardia neocaledoniensis TaxID=236511 RepID=UPI0033D01779
MDNGNDAEDDVAEDLPDEIPDESEGDEELSAEDVQDVLLYTLDWSVQSLLDRIGNTFDINPAFQRRDAWNGERKSQYIESLMLGLPVPQVVLAEDKTSKRFIVLDGKQRLITMKQFGKPDANFAAFKLRKLKFLHQLNGKKFDQIQNSIETDEFAESFLNQPVRTIVVRNWRKTAVLYEIFVRLNRGSLPLSPQELRQALYPGEFSTWVNKRSASSVEIQAARRLKREDFRMRDAELLLRGVAFIDSIESYDGDLREYLNRMCEKGNSDWDSHAARYEEFGNRIEASIRRAGVIFGARNTYLRYVRSEDGTVDFVRRFNVAVFDLMTMVLASPEVDDNLVDAHKDQLREAFKSLCVDDPRFEDSIKSTTKTPFATAYRVIAFGEKFSAITGVDVSATHRAQQLLINTRAR